MGTLITSTGLFKPPIGLGVEVLGVGSSKIWDVYMTKSHPISYHNIMLLGDVYCKDGKFHSEEKNKRGY